MRRTINSRFIFSALTLWALVVLPIAATAQTRIAMPKNKYKLQDDVKVGNDAARQVEQQFPILNDSIAQNYVENVGRRLVDSIPPQFRQPEFNYRFRVVNARDINAFALPGGPMYVNRGMIEAAKNEGEMAGVMAHEISHVALRHATAQATKQSSIGNQLGTIGLILGGAILGGQTGAQAGVLAATAWQTKYSREYETQADVLGAQIMADAGYDPRDLANMFQTIQRESGGGRAPQWLSSHPDPGNRYQNINREASMLRVSPNPIKVTRDFSRVQERLRSMPRAQTMAQIEQEYKRTGGAGGQTPTAGGRYSNDVPYPSARTRVYTAGNVIRFNVPDNWREFSTGNDVQFAPEGGYGDQGITHGVMVGTSSAGGRLDQAVQDYVNAVLQGNNYLSQRTGFSRTTIGDRQAYTTVLSGRSPVTNRTEIVTVYATQLRNGSLLYIDTVTPEQDAYRYNTAFRNLINSVRLND
ncbi:MAG TPA: M48 family metallopeptidase [Pyrinomonadaceae bacterium]|nr:M48 family metallopeptidase [Pyrinomonadaceae bacterium]